MDDHQPREPTVDQTQRFRRRGPVHRTGHDGRGPAARFLKPLNEQLINRRRLCELGAPHVRGQHHLSREKRRFPLKAIYRG